ncbi:MAG TPA: metal ABC transporter ATP-binding protein [Candidatus Eremiobacteraceae bacterium]|nr:metal ABC transporter ATP-binding protein [Candidatus Eremiobacteraceae bacterium]
MSDHAHEIAPAAPHLHKHSGHHREAHPVATPAAIAYAGVCAGYFGRDVLDEVTFTVATGDFVGIIGPNGSGKSTLLKTIVGLHPIECGSASVLGADPSKLDRRRIGYVPQIETVNWSFPVTVYDVVLMGTYGKLGLFRSPSKPEHDAAMRALESVGMADRAGSLIGQLSGGQQQRVFVARALVESPEIMLLDEPIAGVDATTQHAIFALLKERNRRGMTVVATTHDLSCVATWFHKVLCLNHHVVAYGPPSEVLTEATLAATFGSHPLLLGAAAVAGPQP